jgi:hypothetical protein
MDYKSALLAVLLGPTLAGGQDDRPAEPRDGVYRSEVWQGPCHTVRSVSKRGAPGEASSWPERARDEND